MGGAEPACVEALMEWGYPTRTTIGPPDLFIDHGDPRSCCRNAVSTARVSRNRFANAF